MGDNFPSEVGKQVKGSMKNTPSERQLTREECQAYNYDDSGFVSGEGRNGQGEIPKDPPDNEPKMPDGNMDAD